MGFLGKIAKPFKKAAKFVSKPVVKATKWTGRNVDITYSKSIASKGLKTASKVPGLSSALTGVTGGLVLLNKDIRAKALGEYKIGAIAAATISGAGAAGVSGIPGNSNYASPEAVSQFDNTGSAGLWDPNNPLGLPGGTPPLFGPAGTSNTSSPITVGDSGAGTNWGLIATIGLSVTAVIVFIVAIVRR